MEPAVEIDPAGFHADQDRDFCECALESQWHGAGGNGRAAGNRDRVGGCAQFRAGERLCHYAIDPSERQAPEATVPLQTSFPSSLLLPYDNTAGYVMGMALVNLGSAPPM